MFNQPDTPNTGHISVLDNTFQLRRQNNVFPDAPMSFYKTKVPVTKVSPAPPPPYKNGDNIDMMREFDDPKNANSRIFKEIRPVFLALRALGVFPIQHSGSVFTVTAQWNGYSVAVLLAVVGYVVYLKWHKIHVLRNVEGRFEEAVIDYLFTVYLVPIVVNPIALYEARKQADVFTQMMVFERIYSRVARKSLSLNIGNKPLILTIMLPILGCAIMVITHLTMANFVIFQVIPYCYINVVTYMLGGAWYIYCDLIGKIATVIAEDFQQALKNIGPSTRVAEYRTLWMMLSKIIRNVGNSFGYALTFLCLYLFFVITLTIYGLLSQIQEGMGIKDIGLTITAVSAITMLYFICDEAHYASACVRSHFQKNILLVELSWMNDDAQQEINMFLRATEMNPTDMCLCGFFDVNRNLFKSLLATMVTYLVVLLQFQISIPDDTAEKSNSINSTTFLTPSANRTK